MANQLFVEMRLLHSFISHILFPKIGQFDFISNRDLIIMQSIVKKVQINLPRLMMNYMWEATTQKYSSLPYEMVLTLIFKEYKIPITDEEPKRPLRHTCIQPCHTEKNGISKHK